MTEYNRSEILARIFRDPKVIQKCLNASKQQMKQIIEDEIKRRMSESA